jgi:diguanylate cyclase (GGDEF)-like protein
MGQSALPTVDTGPTCILIVDDRPTGRAVLKSVLGPPEYQTTEARGGNEALDLISKYHFDLVILDVVMPDLSGFEVLKIIRQNHSDTELPVIMATMKDSIDDVVTGLELGANDYVTKPIEFPVLLARIETQISRKRAEDALREAHADLEQRIADRTAELVKTNKALRDEVVERKRMQGQLSYQASHDELTGLFNRREFEQRLQATLAATRAKDAQHALCYLDLDQFKVINDTCGHIAGDELLRHLGQWLQARVTSTDTLARLGGDEFGVLLENCTLRQARRVADSLRKAIEEFRFQWEDKTFSLGVSIGLVPFSGPGETMTHLLSTADTACYAAKEEGRNRIYTYLEDDTEIAKHHGEMQWVVRINRAIEEDRFQLYCQPIVPLENHTQSPKKYELLLQMRTDDGHSVMPGSFLPAAERYSLSAKIDRWVVATALGWLTKHKHQRYQYSINLSGQSLGNGEFLEFVIGELDKAGVPARRICFEVTETAAISNLSSAIDFVKAIKQRGCRFALDDFGSGFSSFKYLKTLPVDYLKIDGTFVKDIVDNPIDYAMVKSINEIAHVMGKQTIAEYVENDAILQRVRAAGVNYAQGHGIGLPTPIEELI